jgi:acetate kinase
LNAGSSSIKFSLLAAEGDDLRLVVRGQAEAILTAPRFVAKDAAGATVSSHAWSEGTQLGHDGALEHIVGFLRGEIAVPLAPLHQPHNLAPIGLLLERRPELPQVACFDTAFHRAQPDLAQMFALPWELHEAGVRRYGFHGLSYEFVASVLPQTDSIAAMGRTVVLHLGNGASMCALAAGRSMASTMGFTAVFAA